MEKPLWERESFFKVMFDDFQTRLKIPPCFHKQLRGECLGKSVLRSRGGRRWAVKLRREGNNLFFGEGWECFVSDLTIQLGEFLIFVYDGNIGFDVKIYGITGCEKEDHTVCVKTEKAEEEREEEREEESEEEIEEKREIRGKMAAKTSGSLIQGRRREVLNGHVILGGSKMFVNERALESALSFKSNRPFYIVTFRSTRQEYMTIPVSFMRECDLDKAETIILKDPKGRSWTVRIAHWVGRSAMTKGWPNFLSVNHLIEGDVCVFEFFEADKAMHAHIFRAKECALAVLEKDAKNSKEDLQTSHHLPYEVFSSFNCKYKRRRAVLKAERSLKTDARFASIILKTTKYNLNIPSHILKGKDSTHITKTTLCDPSGRSWPVEIRHRLDGRMVLSQGWFSFCEANNLQEGDACVFDLTNGLEAMDVQIRRKELHEASAGLGELKNQLLLQSDMVEVE